MSTDATQTDPATSDPAAAQATDVALGDGLTLDPSTDPPAPTLPPDFVTAALAVVTAKADYDAAAQAKADAVAGAASAQQAVDTTTAEQGTKATVLASSIAALHALIDTDFAAQQGA